MTPGRVYLAVSLLLLGLVAWAGFGQVPAAAGSASDMWAHASALRALMTDLADPGHPQLAADAASGWYVPLYVVVAAAVGWTGADGVTALAVAGIAGLGTLLAGVWVFFRAYLQAPWAPVAGLALLVAGWGFVEPWSGTFQVRSLLFVAGYPATYAFGLALLLLAGALRALRDGPPRRWWWPVLALGSAVTLVSHPLTGAYLLAAGGVLALVEPAVPVRRKLALAGALAAALVLVELWPWFSFWEVVLGQAGAAREAVVPPQFGTLGGAVVMLGPLLLGVPALYVLARDRRHPFVVAGFVVALAPWLVDRVVTLPLGNRWIQYAAFHLVLALTAVVVASRPPRRVAAAVTALAVVAIAWNFGLAFAELGGRHYGPVITDDIATGTLDDLRGIGDAIPARAVVMAPPELGWSVPAISGKVVATEKHGALVEDAERRIADAGRFFDAATTPAERRALLDRYGVDLVLVEGPVPGALGSPVAAAGDLTLLTPDP